ncbi:hypothetical protein J5N97_010372 [Dioscorea zingiberensis]|uniref:CUE domain-containing protein n=1 Tax=Dioscorea zingiberensis TaxID=325984 RepID=A0A9D5D017_9LILI|nr:hypothetical protein J5N97_010372 [Dioscorea zingiberensis]
MASAPPQRSHGHYRPARNQKRFVPKSDSSASSSAVSDHLKPPPQLTTSLRRSSPQTTRSGDEAKLVDGGGLRFINYLPQDEAVASGLGADDGGVDAEESQRVVDILNEELSLLLKMRPRDFWREVARNDSLHEFLDSYLQFRHRWYDLPHRGAKGTVAGVVVGELELCRRVFMVLYRISSNKDPGGKASDCLSAKEHTALLQEKKLLDLPKLLDICAIYGRENEELTCLLVTNALKAQPTLTDNFFSVVTHLLGIIQTMHQRCNSSLEVLLSAGGHEIRGLEQLYKDFLEVIDFINDAIATLDAFAEAYRPAAMYFANSFELSSGNEELLSTLARLHDSLLPSLLRGLMVINARADGDAILSLKMLSFRIVKFGWKLLEFCYLSNEIIEDDVLKTSAKMFPAQVEDPVIRGDILVQTIKEINEEDSCHIQENHVTLSFLQNLEKNYSILSRISSLRTSGWIFIDEDQFQYLSHIVTPPPLKSLEKEFSFPGPSGNNKLQVDEDAIILESKISQIKDLFPEYGRGFLSACLEVYNQNPEEVIQRILEGTLHEDLTSLDTSLEQMPLPKSVPKERNDKGKGVLVEPAIGSSSLPTKGDLLVARRDVDGPSTGSFSSSHGRYTRKSNKEVVESEILDLRTAKDAVRSAVLAAEYEYEDEYDDSFDDLGLSVVESGFEETENLNDGSHLPGKSWGAEREAPSRNSTSGWASQKKTQFYVKDGKNYSYKVSGSIGVSSAQEAAVVNQAQKEIIHGLGRGGNLPLGAVKKLTDAEEQDHEASDAMENTGRGNSNPRGRGGRRGGGNHYRKDRAMKKHFSSVSGY